MSTEPPPSGKGRNVIFLGCVVAAFAAILGMVAVLTVVIGFGFWAQRGSAVERPAGSRPGWDRFVNSQEGMGEPARTHFVPFSFEYPHSWYMSPGKQQFVLAMKESRHGSGRNQYTTLHESLEVSWYTAADAAVPEPVASSSLIQRLLPEHLTHPGDYRKAREGPTTIAGREGYEIVLQNGDHMVRLVLLPTGGRYGLRLLMKGGPASGLRSAEDLGTSGELAEVLATLSVGR
jgi:hypothetical protein